MLLTIAESEPNANKGRHDPDNSRQKAERLSGLPARTERVTPEVPGPDAAARHVIDSVDEDAKSSEPGEGDEDVHWCNCQPYFSETRCA